MFEDLFIGFVNFVSLFVDLFVDFTVEGVFIARIARGVSRHSARFVAAASIAFVGWVPAIAATSFLPVKMVTWLFVKHFEGTFPLWLTTASL